MKNIGRGVVALTLAIGGLIAYIYNRNDVDNNEKINTVNQNIDASSGETAGAGSRLGE